METNIVYIGLGSNLEQPHQQIKKAIQSLHELDAITVIRNAGYFESKPMGPDNQPDYVNTVVELETTLSATELLNQCQQIESKQGRVKTRHWGERTIDLDVLLYGKEQINLENLIVPHVGLCQRDFVFKPLLKLNKNIEIPGKGLLQDIIEKNKSDNDSYACKYTGCIE